MGTVCIDPFGTGPQIFKKSLIFRTPNCLIPFNLRDDIIHLKCVKQDVWCSWSFASSVNFTVHWSVKNDTSIRVDIVPPFTSAKLLIYTCFATCSVRLALLNRPPFLLRTPMGMETHQQKRFSAALDFFRQEQQIIAKRSVSKAPSTIMLEKSKLLH